MQRFVKMMLATLCLVSIVRGGYNFDADDSKKAEHAKFGASDSEVAACTISLLKSGTDDDKTVYIPRAWGVPCKELILLIRAAELEECKWPRVVMGQSYCMFDDHPSRKIENLNPGDEFTSAKTFRFSNAPNVIFEFDNVHDNEEVDVKAGQNEKFVYVIAYANGAGKASDNVVINSRLVLM